MSELAVAGRVVELVRRLAGPDAEAEVSVLHAAEALTRFANSAIHQNVADATTTVRLRVHHAGRTARGATTVTDAAGLESLVERTVAAAAVCPPDPLWAGLAPPVPVTEGAYDEATARATPDERARRVRDFVRAAGGLETAGFCRTVYLAGAFANSAGQAVEGRASEAGMDGIARVAGADGVARLAGDRLTDIDGATLGTRAAAKARAAGRPVELPPGRYEVVLEPEAVADLLSNLAMYGFNGRAYARGQSFAVLGADQFDRAVTIVDVPTSLPFDAEGTPRAPLTLVERGTTRAVTHDRRSAAEAGGTSTGHSSPALRAFGPMGVHLGLSPAPDGAATPGGAPDGATTPGGAPGAAASPGASPSGAYPSGAHPPGSYPRGDLPAGEGGPTAVSAAPLVRRVERGLLITDLWYTRVLDQKSLVVTGLTRNGVWLIEDGEITAAVGNMRFTQSYPQALAPGAVRGVGAQSVRLPDRWTGVQYAAPALHLASWNLTGNATG